MLVSIAFAILTAIAFEREARKPEVALDTFSTFDTRSGGYAAWFELLERLDRRPQRFERQEVFLDAGVGTYIAANPLASAAHHPFREADAGALERWVRAGGHLVVLGQGEFSDRLRKTFGLPVTGTATHGGRPGVAMEFKRLGITKLSPGPFRFGPAKRYDVLFADSDGAVVLRRRFERGQIIAVVDEGMLTNARIATGDHARLAYALATSGNHLPVAFDESLHDHLIAEHWWELVPGNFLLALGITLAAVAVASVGAAIRFGPPLMPRKRREATSSEYIDALAALFERVGATKRALLDTYISTRRAVARRLGLPDETPDSVLALGLNAGVARLQFAELSALAAQENPKERALVTGAALAYEIRKDVGLGSR